MKKGIYSVTFGVNVENEQDELQIVHALIKDLNRMIAAREELPQAVVEYLHESDDEVESEFEQDDSDGSEGKIAS